MIARLLLLFALSVSPALAARQLKGASAPAVKPQQVSLVRVNVTGQAYDYFRPWQKRAPFSKRALGAVLSDERILVTADLVTNQNYVELERADSGEKTAASVEVVDYESNLALLRPQDKKFLAGLPPLQLATDTVVGDRLSALQLESTGALVVTEGLLTGVQVSRYPADVGQFLTYRLSISLQYRDNSYTVPLVRDNRLAGLLLRYEPRSQLMDVIPIPVIAHFLKDASKPDYAGFPSVGFDSFPLRDPHLRAYAKLLPNAGGVYVTGVESGSAAQKAGLRVGDVISAINNFELDQNGNYLDPLYKKLDYTNLLTTRSYVGDKVTFKIYRDGKPLPLEVTLDHRSPEDFVIPPYSHDEPPHYYILGGLIFQELSRQYLREWGGNWVKDAPQRFVYLDRFQFELFPEGKRRVVVLSQVLPVNGTVGYDDFGYLVVDSVNGHDIKSLADLAAAVKEPVNGFHEIRTQEDPKIIVLDAKQAETDAPILRENFGITELQKLN
ncbi:MAG: serine protease [Verrucomicrobiota bacterium]|nr:serine protease [Verrucomicrobiota bacterium]